MNRRTFLKKALTSTGAIFAGLSALFGIKDANRKEKFIEASYNDKEFLLHAPTDKLKELIYADYEAAWLEVISREYAIPKHILVKHQRNHE